MTSTLYQRFIKRWEEVTDLPPQQLGPFTPVYKKLTRYLKVMPFPIIVLSSLFLVLALYFLLGSAITFLVSILQRGF